jgi:hypothetical protein
VFDLEHHPLVRLVRHVERFRDHAVEPGAFELVEPPLGDVAVGRGRRHVDRRPRLRERVLEETTPRREGLLHQVPVVERQEVEGHEVRGRLLGQEPHAAVGRMDPLLERLELEPFPGLIRHHDLAVDDGSFGQVRLDRFDHLGEVAGHRSLVPAPDLDLVAVAEHDRAEPVPLRLEREIAPRDLGDRLREHRLDGRHHGQAHAGTIARSLSGARRGAPLGNARGP